MSWCRIRRLSFFYLAFVITPAIADDLPKPDDHVTFEGKGNITFKDKPRDITISRKFYKNNGLCPMDKLIISFVEGKVSVNVEDGSTLRANVDREQMSFYLGDPGCQVNIAVRGFEEKHQ